MTKLGTRLREDMPRLATLLTDSDFVTEAQSIDTLDGDPRRRPERRRARRTALVLCVALALVLVAVFAVSQQTGQRVSVPPASDVGRGAPDADTGAIPPGEYLYVRTTGFVSAGITSGRNDGRSGSVSYSVVTPFTNESWIGADGSGRIRTTHTDAQFLTPENEQVFHDAGLAIPDERRQGDRDELVDAGDMDYFELSGLPADVDTLRARLNEADHRDPAGPADPAHLIETVSDWGWAPWARTPVAVRKALVSVLSTTPAMTTEVQDGMTVVSADRAGVRAELWFDDSGLLRRTRRVVSDATIVSGLHAPNGTVLQDVTLEVATLVPSTSVAG